MSPVPTGSRGRGGLGEQGATSCGLSRRHLGFLPPTRRPQSHAILPPSLFSPKPPDRGGVLISEARFSSGLLRFALLTSAAQDYLPESKQNGLTLPRKRRRSRLQRRQASACGVGRGGWHTGHRPPPVSLGRRRGRPRFRTR